MSAPAMTQRLLWRQVTKQSCTSTAAKRFASTSRPTATAGSSPRVASNIRSARRTYSSGGPKGNTSAVKFWPFAAIVAGGFGAYALMANQRHDAMNASKQIKAPAGSTPTFSSDDVTVIFVLGGPGAGKGTQCSNLVRDYGFTHLSAGDLLRAEQQRPGSQFGDLIRDYIKNGLIVPMEVTVQLLENAMRDTVDPSGKSESLAGKKGKFLIDGFPRKFDQAVAFEEKVCPAKFVLFYDCPESEMERRLLERGKTSGRSDDNADSIRKRFRTFIDTSMPVVDYYSKQNKVIRVDSTPKPESVYKTTQGLLNERLGKDL